MNLKFWQGRNKEGEFSDRKTLSLEPHELKQAHKIATAILLSLGTEKKKVAVMNVDQVRRLAQYVLKIKR